MPLFIVAANIMNAGTISDRLLDFCIALVGRFRGGMGYVNIAVSLTFAGMSGSAVADAAGPGKMIVSMMTKGGRYSRSYVPTAKAPGIDPVHFGVVAVVNTMLGLITPPYGMLIFVLNAVTGIPVKEVIRGIAPFLAALLMALVPLMAVPDLVLFLPQLPGYQG